MSGIISDQNKFLIVIAGPTGIGKSALSMKLARRFDAEIFSADSRQIYKEMTIGTAKPMRQELNEIKHHFIDEISVHEPYSVGRYVFDFHKRLEKYFLIHDIGVVTGGTGLYINAVLQGIDMFPDVPEEISVEINKWYHDFGITYIQNQLLELDPEYFHKVDIQNPRRILRALGVVKASEQPYSSFLGQVPENNIPYKVIQILLELPREILYHQINNRVDHMLSTGLEQEARNLYHLKHLRALQTVGYTEMFDYFDGKLDLSRAIEMIKQNSRRYAKRQITWFKKYGNWICFHPMTDEDIFKHISAVTGNKI
ncbi:MAG: tRNA (adenosine(37)-N6)-dimethylallyltransferase MiaA [Saprospiraceae bacterium]|nr:tRNA (adenosine(37)-N6)-dimethylallyltransferase MiaA [Saprospiraceae bacterium]